ncbi:LAME_0F18448g1_1 [Lachancea meyersii CBS 8951]|uniref:Protein BTN n=1 Tax=Lachancea meyersii CBS 8951 TaxID=1266667 RepID=A0A1G4K0N9_9SACH|nr:LAME_0F18448g1_1 [Lachancea meyersii CBS 8951]
MASDSLVFRYFWIFGLINNVLYVVILSAAADIVGPGLPKALVLLLDILPAFVLKLTAPFFIHKSAHRHRIAVLIGLSCVGMVLVAGRKLSACVAGIILASLSSGLGELTFLQLTHYYQQPGLNGWSSGTGGAGLFGSGMYMLLTSILKVPVNLSLLLFSVLPFAFLLYFRLDKQQHMYANVENDYASAGFDFTSSTTETEMPVDDSASAPHIERNKWTAMKSHVSGTLLRIKGLVVPYMLPLSVVYLFEYMINQGVSPTLLFPLDEKHSHPFFFHKYRDIYVTYGTLYQLGVFISRSSGSLLQIRRLYILAILQGLNLALAISQSWFYVVRSVYPVMFLIFFEGLLGGASYVHTFKNIIHDVDISEREFSLGAVSMSDSFGVLLAAFAGIALEPRLCSHQVDTGRPWCLKE